MAKDPPKKKPCPCRVCKGALMSKRTIIRHRNNVPPVAIPRFEDWAVAEGGETAERFNALQRQADLELELRRSNEEDIGISPDLNETSEPYEPEFNNHEVHENAEIHNDVNISPDVIMDDSSMHPESPPINNLQLGTGNTEDEDELETEAQQANTNEVETAQGQPEDTHTSVDPNISDDERLAPENPSEGGDDLDDANFQASRIENLRISQQFIKEISEATLDIDSKLDEEVIERLRNPEEGPVDISDPDTRLSIDLFISCEHASQKTYSDVRDAIMRRSSAINILSYGRVKDLVARITGVVSIMDDICVNSCHAFTGPFTDLESCFYCSEPRYDPSECAKSGKLLPRKQELTIPIGPVIQALRRSEQGSLASLYLDKKIAEIFDAIEEIQGQSDKFVYDDIFAGNDILNFMQKNNVTSNDTTLLFSIDGAQLQKSKKSDTWIGIWIIGNYSPTSRYKKKHVIPAFVVPGPDKPKNMDSMLFRSFQHLSALQRENNGAGLRVWDFIKNSVILSRPFNILELADAPGLTEMDGRVGHHGAYGCRTGCEMEGTHKPSSGHYYAVHLRPDGIGEEGRLDFDFDSLSKPRDPKSVIEAYEANLLKVLKSHDQTEYERNRKLTGISKPSIISGLNPNFNLAVPLCFSLDLMHCPTLNVGEMIILIWRGKLKCEPTDNVATWDWATFTGEAWINHGKVIANATAYFPSSFHRPPRNPAEKISSGYKATEYYIYLYGLGPAVFRQLLPQKYWRNFCKLVRGVRIIIQRRITGAQLREAHSFLVQFVREFESLYYQRRMDRIHFCRPCLHTLLHACPEATRVGPGAYSTQFTMERSIGDLGQDIRQYSNPFANLSQIALRRSQINALKSMCPDVDSNNHKSSPAFSFNCENGYIFLTPRQREPMKLMGMERTVVEAHVQQSFLRKWGRICLPNGQIARSVFAEGRRISAGNTRVTRNVKIKHNEKFEFGEVQFYFLLVDPDDNDKLKPYALVSLYGPPDADMLEDSYHTLWASEYTGSEGFCIIPVTSILSVVSMQPFPRLPGDPENLWFVVEKSGLDDIELTGYVDPLVA